MKTYVKPKLMALSLSCNDLLCSCNPNYSVLNPDFLNTLRDLYPNLDLSNPRALFGASEGCDAEVGDTEFYCKNTPTDNLKVFAS